jgi:hypothetical protein
MSRACALNGQWHGLPRPLFCLFDGIGDEGLGQYREARVTPPFFVVTQVGWSGSINVVICRASLIAGFARILKTMESEARGQSEDCYVTQRPRTEGGCGEDAHYQSDQEQERKD